MNALKVILFGHDYPSNDVRHEAAIISELRQIKAEIFIDKAFATKLQKNKEIDLTGIGFITPESNYKADFAISIGGDGTFLKAAAYVGPEETPILGINTGHLGFLTDISPTEFKQELQAYLRGEYVIKERSVIEVNKEDGSFKVYPFALNEVAITKHDNSSLINISAYINGALMANYVADGVIVCTPTGSTAYSLSVNGPIIAPNSDSFCISPIASHSLNMRPVIVKDDVEIKMKITGRSSKFLIAIDGRNETVKAGTTLTIKKAPYIVKVLKIKHQKFFDTLRNKMMWGEDRRF